MIREIKQMKNENFAFRAGLHGHNMVFAGVIHLYNWDYTLGFSYSTTPRGILGDGMISGFFE